MARQLAAIARLRHDPDHQGAALQALSPLVSGGAARSLLIGKVGLALSGGGFRASLFHVGVLARLAELDLLRQVEVLSCVSGGSILGALYYLELRQRLQTKPDYDLSRGTFIEIVTAVQDKLLLALKRDIRTSAILRSLWSLTTDRTILTAQMIDQALYANSDAPRRRLHDLTIVPQGETPDFHPRRDNWRRAAKAPVLILNATSLNTGHNWQFTATYMGEAPTSIEPVVDATERLRRMYYREAPHPHNEIELFTAVGASSAAPGVFPPITLKGLYPDRVVRLSDGGVHDNQGIFALIEQDCNVMIVSDGCGQLTTETKPSWWLTRVLMRTNNVLMDAVRRNSYRILASRLRSQRIKELHFIHLKRGLATRDVTWIRGRPEDGQAVPCEKGSSGLDAQTQRALAAIRTDLDCFSENECHALMFAGYRIADRDFTKSPIVEASARSAPRANWKFLRVADWLDEHTASTAPKAFFEELQCGRHLFFRRLRLSRSLRVWKSLRGTW
jgi:predicted acylesterase/phospholipase RssA